MTSRYDNERFSAHRREHFDGPYTAEEVALAARNPGIPLEALRYDVTPIGMHYQLSHFDVPEIDAAAWRLSLTGTVAHPLSLSLAELQAMDSVNLRVTLECAGNGRGFMHPRYPSRAWFNEAVSTAEWTGVPLARVLEQAKLRPATVELSFIGADRGFDAGFEHEYGRSLTRDHAMREEVMLAWAMNGAPLLPQHGAPVRLIVPGWYGMASVKWLTAIEALDRPFDGYQQVVGYHYRKARGEPGLPVTTMRVRALMIPPGIPDWYSRARLVEAGPVALRGRAWSGAGAPITGVEVEIDGEWRAARLEAHHHRYAWRGWRSTWQAVPGEHVLRCRATDADGVVQPDAVEWNAAGMGNNAPQRVQVFVR
jgi:DMSO/TMAO reductase YedYZ molybdopterin-dependent catalytic subunit